MQKRIIALVLAVLLILMIVVCRITPAFADPMTLTQISSIAYAIGSSFGFQWGFDGYSSTGVNSYLENEINSWLGSSTIAEKFGIELARIELGKLIVPAMMYNGIKEFLQNYKEEHALIIDPTSIYLQSGDYRCYANGVAEKRAVFLVVQLSTGSIQTLRSGAHNGMINHGVVLANATVGGVYGICGAFSYTGSEGTQYQFLRAAGSDLQQIEVSFDGTIPETVLNPDEEWTGTIGGQPVPDTNIDDLLGHIDDMVLDGTITVEGEVTPVVPPTPAPTPVPADTPLSDVPWGDFDDTIGSDIGDIADQTGDISESLDDVAEDVQSIEQTLTDALDIPTEEEAEEAKFDLSLLFPFCIPFDIYRMLQQFNSDPVAPHVQLPFVIESIGFEYILDLDFDAWSPVAAALRAVEFILYGISLAWATSKVIKW